MGFPIYYCGTLLFRDGRPAFSTRCCCGPLIPCCGTCYFPVTFRLDPGPEDNFEVGGPTQIIDAVWTFDSIDDSGETAFIEWRQSGTSTHYTQSAAVDDDCALRSRTFSRCFFDVPMTAYDEDGNRVQVENDDGTFSDLPPTSYRFSYSGDLWGSEVAAVVGDLISGSGEILSTCNSGTWDFTWRAGTTTATQTGSFSVTGAKPWPAGFECRTGSPRPSGEESLWNVAKNRWAVESDMPEGFL